MFYVSEKNWNKIIGYAEEAYEEHKAEIGGMSVMVKDKDNDWELQRPVILQQEISCGNTILDKDALAVYYTKEAKKMGKQNFRFCWWHSHHTMKAFWSPTDLKAIDEYSDGDFSFALVVNLEEEYKFRTSVWKPFKIHQDVTLEIMRAKKCTKNMKKEVEELCSTRTYSWKRGNNAYKGYQSVDQLEDPRQERIPFHHTVGSIESFGKQMLFSDIIDEIDRLNGEVIERSIEYQEYEIGINDLNTKLKKENNSYKVELITKNKLETLQYLWPGQLIKYKDTDVVVYDESFYGGY